MFTELYGYWSKVEENKMEFVGNFLQHCEVNKSAVVKCLDQIKTSYSTQQSIFKLIEEFLLKSNLY